MSDLLTEELKKLWLQNVYGESKLSNNVSLLTKEKYDIIIPTLRHGKPMHGQDGKAITSFYTWNKKFMVTEVQGKDRLLYRPRRTDGVVVPLDQLKEAVCVEDAFERIHTCHITNGHPKGLSLHKKLEGKYGKSITKNMCSHYPV